MADLRTLTRLVAACGLELSLDVEASGCDEPARTRRSVSSNGGVHPAPVADDVRRPGHCQGLWHRGTAGAETRWSGPRRSYDLSDRQDRARVYEQVLREGTDDDVRRFIRLDELADLWDDLVMSTNVRDAWEPKLQGRGRKPN